MARELTWNHTDSSPYHRRGPPGFADPIPAGMSMAVLTPSTSGLGSALDPHPHPAGVWERYAAGLTTGRASARGGCLAYQPDQSDRARGHGDHG